MAKTETGWTKEFPKVDGDYFTRDDENDSWVIPVRISGGQVFEFGLQGDCRHLYGNTEYLGPISPSDAEQLMELRSALNHVLDDLRSLSREPSAKQARMKAQIAYDKLRTVLVEKEK